MFYFKTKDSEIIVEYKWGSAGAISSAVSSWRTLAGGSGGKSSDKFWSFYIRRANKQLKIEETQQVNCLDAGSTLICIYMLKNEIIRREIFL